MPYVPKNKNPRFKIIIGTLLVLVLTAVFVVKSNLNLKDVLAALSALNPIYLFLVFVMGLLQVLFWMLRPWFLLPKSSQLSLFSLAKAISIGQFLNSFAPARAGDVTKVILLSSKKTKHALTPSTAIGVLASDKVVDLIAVVLLAVFSGAMGMNSSIAQKITEYWFVGLLIPVILFLFLLVLPVSLKEKVRNFLKQFLAGIQPLLSPKAFCLSLIIAFSVWVCEALALFFVLKAGEVTVGFSDAVYLMCIVNLAILVPVSVANVGAFEAAFVYGVSKFQVGMDAAVAFAMASHVLQAAALCAWALVMFKFGGKHLKVADDLQ